MYVTLVCKHRLIAAFRKIPLAAVVPIANYAKTLWLTQIVTEKLSGDFAV